MFASFRLVKWFKFNLVLYSRKGLFSRPSRFIKTSTKNNVSLGLRASRTMAMCEFNWHASYLVLASLSLYFIYVNQIFSLRLSTIIQRLVSRE